MKNIILSISLLIAVLSAHSQSLKTPTLSPFTKITQQVGLTEIGLEYSRPSAKGRTVFGDLVPYNKIWRTGANASTKIFLSEPAKIGGNPIDSGTYALYTIPGKDRWTIIIHSNIRMRSIAGDVYKPELDVFRFETTPGKTSNFVETFTIQFSDLTSKSVHLALSWEETTVSFPIEVEVDQKIDDQMSEFLKTPEEISSRVYFQAAQYYLHNDKDLDKALEWINEALVKSPKNFRFGLLKSKIQYKKGDRTGAMETINEANEWATEAGNANYMEQTDLFRKSMKE